MSGEAAPAAKRQKTAQTATLVVLLRELCDGMRALGESLPSSADEIGVMQTGNSLRLLKTARNVRAQLEVALLSDGNADDLAFVIPTKPFTSLEKNAVAGARCRLELEFSPSTKELLSLQADVLEADEKITAQTILSFPQWRLSTLKSMLVDDKMSFNESSGAWTLGVEALKRAVDALDENDMRVATFLFQAYGPARVSDPTLPDEVLVMGRLERTGRRSEHHRENTELFFYVPAKLDLGKLWSVSFAVSVVALADILAAKGDAVSASFLPLPTVCFGRLNCLDERCALTFELENQSDRSGDLQSRPPEDFGRSQRDANELD